jgi:uncharacterized protein with HEPN domain
MRNKFAHSYISMNSEMIWQTAMTDIPILSKFCNFIIEKYKPTENNSSPTPRFRP